MNENRSNKSTDRDRISQEVRWVHVLAERARDLEEIMSKMDGGAQAAVLRELFRASEMVFGIWRDDTSPAGYRYSVMKGAPKAAFERYLAEGGPFIFCAVFREGSMEAEFMKEIYEIEQRNLNDKTMQDFCSAMWLNMAPANWSTTMGRIRDLLR